MIDHPLDWLPDRHLGVVATLSHADELIGQITDLLFDYQTHSDGVIGLREVLGDSCSQTVVDRVAPIPRKVPLLVADALVVLRAAIEHTLFVEVEHHEGAPLGEKAAKLVEMPACATHQKFVSWTKKQVRDRPPSLAERGELTRRIEILQPFQRSAEPSLHPLARLVLHTNHAKHRTPAVTAVRLAAMYEDRKMPHSERNLPPRPEEPLCVGNVIAETPLGTRVPVTLFPTVGINRPGTDRWPVLMQELGEISHWVRTQTLPHLIAGANPPAPVLPTRYEIAVGHEDERAAIRAGSMITAAERFTQRLTAASARIDLVGLLDQHDGCLNHRQLTAWLDHLTDEEVLERVSRLRTAFTYNPGLMRHNIRVLNCLHDEARAFDREEQPDVEI